MKSSSLILAPHISEERNRTCFLGRAITNFLFFLLSPSRSRFLSYVSLPLAPYQCISFTHSQPSLASDCKRFESSDLVFIHLCIFLAVISIWKTSTNKFLVNKWMIQSCLALLLICLSSVTNIKIGLRIETDKGLGINKAIRPLLWALINIWKKLALVHISKTLKKKRLSWAGSMGKLG